MLVWCSRQHIHTSKVSRRTSGLQNARQIWFNRYILVQQNHEIELISSINELPRTTSAGILGSVTRTPEEEARRQHRAARFQECMNAAPQQVGACAFPSATPATLL